MKSSVTVSAVTLLVLVALTGSLADTKPPVVNVYTQAPVEYGVKNTLICLTSGFHPPRIEMRLMKSMMPFENCMESDLSFKQDWTYHKSKHVDFIPEKGVEYGCEVTHNEGTPKLVNLEMY